MKQLWIDTTSSEEFGPNEVEGCSASPSPGIYIAIIEVTERNYDQKRVTEAFIKCKSKKEAKAALKKVEVKP